MSFRPISARALPLLTLALCALVPAGAEACTACMGKPTDSAMAGAMNGAIYFMLVCIGGMMAFIATVGVLIVRRSHAPMPPHQQFTATTLDPTDKL